jgi:hypothetical protein
MCARFRLFHAGVIDRKDAGSLFGSGAYQSTPKPSPFSGSLLSWE